MTNEAALADSSSPPRRQSRACLWWGLLGVAAVAGAASTGAAPPTCCCSWRSWSARSAMPRAGSSPAGGAVAWGALAYLGMVSMFLGYIAWYRGLSIGPMTGVSQVQLLQPLMSVCWAWGLLGERVGWTTVLGGVAVIVFALLAMRSRGNAR